jgi:hypothetical protein
MEKVEQESVRDGPRSVKGRCKGLDRGLEDGP